MSGSPSLIESIEFGRIAQSLPWLPQGTIFLTRHGSQAYGTNLPTSDLDVKGVAVPPRAYFLGFAQRFEQAESRTPDLVIYDVRKFMALAAECNPNIIEVLWTDVSDHLLVRPAGQLLLDAREAFLSRKARYTFSGYAVSQLRRIQTHHRWLVSPPIAAPTRSEYGLPERTVIPQDQLQAAEADIRKKVESWDIDVTTLDPAARIDLQARMVAALAEIGLTLDGRFAVAGRALGFDDALSSYREPSPLELSRTVPR